jgi:hypothetical protein
MRMTFGNLSCRFHVHKEDHGSVSKTNNVGGQETMKLLRMMRKIGNYIYNANIANQGFLIPPRYLLLLTLRVQI